MARLGDHCAMCGQILDNPASLICEDCETDHCAECGSETLNGYCPVCDDEWIAREWRIDDGAQL
jgi:hypothetical protein